MWAGVPPQQGYAPHGHQTTQHIGEKLFLSNLVAALTNSIIKEYCFYKSSLLSFAKWHLQYFLSLYLQLLIKTFIK